MVDAPDKILTKEVVPKTKECQGAVTKTWEFGCMLKKQNIYVPTIEGVHCTFILSMT